MCPRTFSHFANVSFSAKASFFHFHNLRAQKIFETDVRRAFHATDISCAVLNIGLAVRTKLGRKCQRSEQSLFTNLVGLPHVEKAGDGAIHSNLRVTADAKCNEW